MKKARRKGEEKQTGRKEIRKRGKGGKKDGMEGRKKGMKAERRSEAGSGKTEVNKQFRPSRFYSQLFHVPCFDAWALPLFALLE